MYLSLCFHVQQKIWVANAPVQLHSRSSASGDDKHIIHVHFWDYVKQQGRFNLIWCVTTDGLLSLIDLMHKLQNYSMQSHRSLVINKGGDLTDSFLSEQSVRDLLLLDRLVLSWLSVRHESLSEALSDTQRAVHRSYQDFQQLKQCNNRKNEE